MESSKVPGQYVLRLDEREATWLKGLVQNRLVAVQPEDELEMEPEGQFDQEMRKKIWDALSDRQDQPESQEEDLLF